MHNTARSLARLYVVTRDWLVSYPVHHWFDSSSGDDGTNHKACKKQPEYFCQQVDGFTMIEWVGEEIIRRGRGGGGL